ncbi:hypothetical protein BKA70DRAFT_1456021 [Coprinopsis sp. MPI-PUGE-AT-0042]|nr:hypothetical protein BKA70DRAFT_1456021 [Coprinopsis sp. MPI-PUGE-AT-0042]
MILLRTSWLLISTALLLPRARAVDVTVPLTAPATANAIPADYVAFSVELDGWLQWVGKDTRNQFFYNALENLREITGVPPRIRVGGRSGDIALYSQTVDGISVGYPAADASNPYPDALRVSVGDKFYRSSLFLPNNTKVTHTLNFYNSDTLRGGLHLRSILQAYLSQDFVDRGIVLDSIEIGHEPDTYTNRPPPYTSTRYVTEWSNWAGQIMDAVPSLHPAARSFNLKLWAASLSPSSPSNGWSPRGCFQDGLLEKTNAGPAVNAISQHHYHGGRACPRAPSLGDFMSKSMIRTNISVFADDAAATKSHDREYILGETGSFACHGVNGISNSAASAIWALDYLLHAAQAGVSRIFFHQGVGYHSNFIQPAPLTVSPTTGAQLTTPLAARVNPQYYAAIVAAEAIGASGTTRVTELDTRHASVSGYAFYEGTKLARAVLINSAAYLKTASTRPTVPVSLKFGSGGPTKATVKRLEIGSADDTANLKWGDVSYETDNARSSGSVSSEQIDLAAGFNLKATEAVLLVFS